jgi:hypothetical protein
MSKTLKLTLDILIGAAAPVVILKYGTASLGTLNAYLLAALVPVVWVMLDLFVITRRFNFITTYGGLSAVMRGALAFWYVDGALFAFKDSASYLLAFVVFGVTALLDEPTVLAAMKRAGVLIGVSNLAAGAVNYVINVRMVVAPFNTPSFNDQVANVNAITRLVLVLPDMLALFFAFSMMYKAMYALLPADEGADPDAGEFWTLLARREDAMALVKAGDPSGIALGAGDVQSRAARQAREEFGLS